MRWMSILQLSCEYTTVWRQHIVPVNDPTAKAGGLVRGISHKPELTTPRFFERRNYVTRESQKCGIGTSGRMLESTALRDAIKQSYRLWTV